MPNVAYQIEATFNLPAEGLSTSQDTIQQALHDAIVAIGTAAGASDSLVDVGEPTLEST